LLLYSRYSIVVTYELYDIYTWVHTHATHTFGREIFCKL